MKVWLVGMGCGPDTWTAKAAEIIGKSDLIVGAARMLEGLDGFSGEKAAEYRPQAIAALLAERQPERVCILLSGDSGFYSAAAGLLPLLAERGMEVAVLPGISSVQYLAARLGRSWQDWRLCSAHGVDCDPVQEVMQGTPVFFLTSGGDGARSLCRTLTEAGLGGLTVTVGENLGQPSEQITAGTAAELSRREIEKLNVLLVEPAPVYPTRTPGIPDGEFLREKIPMTKQEVRTAILAKLAICPDDICWDIGAGTGSVSVELALHGGTVWAVERNPEALALARRNREKFCAWNLRLLEGEAPAVLEGLPAPDKVFLGGSGGQLPEILRAVHRANPAARVCVSAIALETLHQAAETLGQLGYETEVTQIAVSRTRAVGELHLLMAQNPVFLITGVRP